MPSKCLENNKLMLNSLERVSQQLQKLNIFSVGSVGHDGWRNWWAIIRSIIRCHWYESSKLLPL
jgi:hypothetical protein